MAMKPIFEQAAGRSQRIAFADGEDERVLRATQVILEDGVGRPILIGRPSVIEQRLERFGLKLKIGTRFRGDQSRGRPALSRLCRRFP